MTDPTAPSVPAPAPPLPAAPSPDELVKALSACVRFGAVVVEVMEKPAPTVTVVTPSTARRSRGRKKGAAKHPEARPTGEYIWAFDSGGYLVVKTQQEAERIALAINDACREGLKAEIASHHEALLKHMVSTPLTLGQFKELRNAHFAFTNMAQDWVTVSKHGEQSMVLPIRFDNPLRFTGDHARESANVLAEYVNAIVRPFVDPVQLRYQEQIYELLRHQPFSFTFFASH